MNNIKKNIAKIYYNFCRRKNVYKKFNRKIRENIRIKLHSKERFKITNSDKLRLLVYINEKNVFYIPDKMFLKLFYKYHFNKKLNLRNPKTYTEKLQWLKLYDRNPIYTKMVDKYEVKDYVEKIIGSEYIVPTYGVYDNFDEIDFDSLPDRFVIKCTHSSGDVIICHNKKDLNIEEIKKAVNKTLKRNFFYHKREWPYKNVKPRIIIEKNIATENQKELINYKFFCFNGKPSFIYLSQTNTNTSELNLSFLDINYNKMKMHTKDYIEMENIPERPNHFDKMKQLAEILSKGMTFIRVDFYEVDNKVYFSELTFFPHSGLFRFEPEEYDTILGDMIKLPNKKIKEKHK